MILNPSQDPDLSQSQIRWYLDEGLSLHKIWFKSLNKFLRHPAHRQTNRIQVARKGYCITSTVFWRRYGNYESRTRTMIGVHPSIPFIYIRQLGPYHTNTVKIKYTHTHKQTNKQTRKLCVYGTNNIYQK